MNFDQVLPYLAEAAHLGVKEFYFTGGEPFINPDLPKILEATLQIGPATVLTNATFLSAGLVAELAKIRDASKYSLELRVSMDGFSPETNDPIRGPGTFKRAMRGVKLLLDGSFLPIITAMRSWPMEEDEAQLCGFKNSLAAVGYRYPRIKLLPSLKIGQEALRDRGYSEHDYITESMMVGYDTSQLMCSNSRIVSARGVHVCPILVDQPDSILGKRLSNANPAFRLSHQACMTCYRYGALCSNASSAAPSFEKMRLSRRNQEQSYSESSNPNIAG
jgi:AdoMet-dependent heme synthase